MIEEATVRTSSPSSAVAPWFMRISTTSSWPHAAAQDTKECPAGDTRERSRATASLPSPQACFWDRYSAEAVACAISFESSWRLFFRYDKFCGRGELRNMRENKHANFWRKGWRYLVAVVPVVVACQGVWEYNSRSDFDVLMKRLLYSRIKRYQSVREPEDCLVLIFNTQTYLSFSEQSGMYRMNGVVSKFG